MVADGVTIGDFCKIQNNVSPLRGRGPGGLRLLRAQHGVHQRDHAPLPVPAQHQRATTPTTLVKRGASIGANATIVCGVTLHEVRLRGGRCGGDPGRAALRHGGRRAGPDHRLHVRTGRTPAFDAAGRATTSYGQRYLKDAEGVVRKEEA